MRSSIIFGNLQALSWLIFLFGVVNLINTTLSNQISRKRENGILRLVGLTGKRLCRMSILYGGSPVRLDGAQAEKAVPGRTDAGTRVNYSE